MNTTAPRWLRRSVVAVGAFLAACAGERPVGPVGSTQAATFASGAGSAADSRGVDLTACPKLQAPAGTKLALRVYAQGVQIYRWNGTGWSFVGPEANLSADAAGQSTVGIHYAGPTWESNSGGKVYGTVVERCTPNPNAIAWLLLSAVSEGSGIFHRVTHIQRVNTVGGNAPSRSGLFTGEEARVPYTTEYLFYRSH